MTSNTLLALISVLLSLTAHALGMDTTVTVNIQDPAITWTSSLIGPQRSTWTLKPVRCGVGTSQVVTSRFGDSITFVYMGTGISVIGAVGRDGGIVDFNLDGQHQAINCSAEALTCGVILFESPASLPFGRHTLVASLSSDSRPEQRSIEGTFSVQRIQYLVPAQTNPQMRTAIIAVSTVGGLLLLILAITATVYFNSRSFRRLRRGRRRRSSASENERTRPSGTSLPPEMMIAEPFRWPATAAGGTAAAGSSRDTSQPPANGSEDPGSSQPLLQSSRNAADGPDIEVEPSPTGNDEEIHRDWLRAHTLLVMTNPDGEVGSSSQPVATSPKEGLVRQGALAGRVSNPSSPVGDDRHFINQVAERLANIVLARKIADVTQRPPSYVQRLDSDTDPLSSPSRAGGTSTPPNTVYHEGPSQSIIRYDTTVSPDPEGIEPESSPLLSRQVAAPVRFGPRPMPQRRRASSRTSSVSLSPTSPRFERRGESTNTGAPPSSYPAAHWRHASGDSSLAPLLPHD